ncbi:hypothetical protein BS47DRAFT_857392 [Hydnum rufescens UP504]|uniref:Uncharacterized protein n=1 Tax=Hydnum rufescens UP504 TaxID=1448309 RepID=A0A9P6ADL3_9AGAM|nr:hypothetical protein BS47DRAFT_857392 [Hydnum rufescens UP504]
MPRQYPWTTIVSTGGVSSSRNLESDATPSPTSRPSPGRHRYSGELEGRVLPKPSPTSEYIRLSTYRRPTFRATDIARNPPSMSRLSLIPATAWRGGDMPSTSRTTLCADCSSRGIMAVRRLSLHNIVIVPQFFPCCLYKLATSPSVLLSRAPQGGGDSRSIHPTIQQPGTDTRETCRGKHLHPAHASLQC